MCTGASAEERRGRRTAVCAVSAGLLSASLGVAALTGGLSAPAAAATKPTITGTGSSYAALAINQWVAEVSALYGDNVNYSTQSSVIGLNDFAQYPQVDFGASEIGYSSGQSDQEPPSGFSYQYLPDIAGAVCLDYNLTNSFGQQITNLRLDSSVMAGIFSGAITNWDDPQLRALNPGVSLPSSPIIVVYRTDASGDNFIFSDYLYDTQQSAWNTFTAALGQPSGAQAIWPLPPTGARTVGIYDFGNWTGENGSDNASNYVYQSSGTITYVETGYAILHHDPCAAVQNASGAFVQPSESADAIALQNDALKPDLEQTLTPVFMSSESAAYPVSAYSYLVMAEQSEIPGPKQQVEAQFVQFLACAGQEAAGKLGYSPLPPNLVEADFSAVDRIDGVQLPAPTASNCPDPYVTGAFNAAPPPVVSSTTSGTSAGAATSPASTSSSSASSSSSSSSSSSPSSSSSTAGSTTVKPTTTPKHHALVSVEPPPGQQRGPAMQSAVNDLLRAPAPVALIVLAAVGFLLVLVIPPVIGYDVRRHHRRKAASHPNAGQDEG